MIIKPVKVIGSIVTLFLAAMALASCTGSVVCTTPASPALAVTVLNASGDRVCDAAVTATDGKYSVRLPEPHAGSEGLACRYLRPLRSPRQLHRARASGLLKQDHLEHCCESPGSVLPGGNPADHGAVLIDSIEDLVLRLGSPEGEGSASAQFGNHAGQSSRCWVHPVPSRTASSDPNVVCLWSACPL